jgi:hypothetical protein
VDERQENAMTAGHLKVSHIVSIGFMAALLLFFVFSALAGESSPLLSSTTAQAAAVQQTTGDRETADRAT